MPIKATIEEVNGTTYFDFVITHNLEEDQCPKLADDLSLKVQNQPDLLPENVEITPTKTDDSDPGHIMI